MSKQYRAKFLLGFQSETDDVEGEVSKVVGAAQPSPKSVDDALSQFLGEIEQVPPAHSAVKIGGRRAYKLARAGKAVELSPRVVTIHQLAIRRYEYPDLELDIECGSGTYVRSIGRDLAAALGTSAVMSALERTAIGEFRVEEALPLEAITAEIVSQRLQPALVAVVDLPRVTISHDEQIELQHGRPIKMPPNVRGPVASNELAAISPNGQFIGILRAKHSGELWPIHNFGPAV